jgi:hypothetical protein
MKFDDGKVEKYLAYESSSGRSDILFIHPYEKIVSKLRKAKRLQVEANFYQEGRHQLEFEVSGFNWH